MGQLNIMDKTGHTTIDWSKDDAASMKLAQETFEKLLAGGHAAFETSGPREGKVASFNPDADEIVMRLPLQGG